MNKSFDEEGLQFAWDSTSIKLAEECLYKYKLKMLIGWRPINESIHLRFGGIYASSLEHFHKHIANGIDREEAIIKVIHEALIATWDYDDCETCGSEGEVEGKECPTCEGQGKSGGQPWNTLDTNKTRETLIRTLVWYFETFADDPCKTIVLSNGQAAVEHSFKLPVDNGIVFCGHLDRLVDFGNRTYIQDQKTTKSTISAQYFKQYNPDSQIAGMYPFAGSAIYKIAIKGVMIDAAQIAVGFSRFERGFIFTDSTSLNEWYDDTMYHIEKARTATKEQNFPRNRSACHKFAGCEFRGICSHSPDVRNQFLKADFEQRPRWDPMESR